GPNSSRQRFPSSSPDEHGIWMSVITISGRCSFISSQAASPLEAVPQISILRADQSKRQDSAMTRSMVHITTHGEVPYSSLAYLTDSTRSLMGAMTLQNRIMRW